MESTAIAVRHRSAWSWLPAIVAVVATVVITAGVSLMPRAEAAGGDTNVDATVGASLNFTGCGATISFASNFTTGGPEQVSPACSISFDTNNSTGAKLDLTDNDATAPFFCNNSGATCGGANEFSNTASSFGTLAAGEFGAALETVNGDASGGAAGGKWDVDANASVVAGDPSFYPIQETAGADTQVCEATTATAASGCVIVFGGQPKALQIAGTYRGTAHFVLTTQ